MATKILHTADWHLGLRFLGFGEHDRRLTQQRLTTVRNILGVAERYAVDAVLVAGDVFDSPDPGETWWGQLAKDLHAQPWQGRPLVLLPGNHDPLIPTSVWRNRAFREALPGWVHIVDRDDFTLELGDGAVIHAVPCRRTAGQADMAAHLPRRAPGDTRVRIAMLHGQTFGFPGLATNFPIGLDTATTGGFDYVALGDTHARRIHGPESSPMIYPGAPEPTRFGETDAGTVTLALFGRRNRAPMLQAEPVGHFRWQERTVTTLSELRALRSEDHRQTVMRLHVAMTLPVDEHAQAEAILRELEGNEAQPGKIAIATVDRAKLALDASGVLLALDDLPEQVRETARRLQAMIAAGERADVAERALVQLYQVARHTGGDVNDPASPQHHFGLRRLEVESFKCVESAALEFGPGLNVLYGPNDLGKSSLGEAIRAVLLLPSSSSERKSFEAWGAAKPTRVRLSFTHRGQLWRVDKTWGEGTRAAALLERSSDGHVWSKEETGRAVDAELRKMLGWGVREPGGRGAPKGLPKSFITTALLGANSRIEELFAENLADDTDPAGRERLSEALQSLAEDPLFKRILTVAQERVEKSKDSRGNWRRGREAPLGRIAERIRELAAQHESLMRQAEQSESVHEVLRSHRDRRAALLEAIEAARGQRDRLQSAYEAGATWRTAQAALASARAQLDAIDRELARVAALRAEADAARTEAAACIERGEAAAGAVAAAEHGQREAAEALAALERDDGAAARVDELRRRELTLSRDRQRLAERTEQLGAALALEATAGTDTGRAEAADAAGRRAEHEHAAWVAELAAKTRAQDELAQQVALLQWREAAALAERTEQANTNARSLAARARLLREAATRRRAELDRSPAPDRATIDLLTEREARLRRAEDQAAVGFAVRLTLADGRTVTITADGAAAIEVTGDSTHVASRELTVDLGATGSIHVEAGSAALRAELQRARADWAADGAPILAAFGVADLPALSELAARGQAQADQCAKDEAQATALEREAAAGAVDDAALAAVRAGMQRATEALRSGDARELDAIVEALSKAIGGRSATEIHAEHASVRAAVEAARARLAQAELERGLAVAEAERARLAAAASVAKADAARRALPPALAADLVTARAEAEDELAELGQKLAELASAIDEAASRGQQATAGARARLEAATAAVTSAKAEALEHEVRIAAARERAAATGARADEAAAAASALSRETTAALVAKLEAECAALPEPSATVDADALAAATARIGQLEQQLRDTDAEIQKAEGSLEQIGGPTMRRRADETAGELAEAKQIEADLQREFEGWQLLRDTLRAVETEQGAHLGNALGGAVEARLRRLTAGRYGRLDLDRDLRAQGLRIAGSPRALDVLSAGLKEQLATLIRLAIAEHLDASVILDDHLAQTDPDRVEFFRALLREIAAEVQIVVLTCRPLDYLEAAELPIAVAAQDRGDTVRAVDLARVIARGGATGP